MARRKNQSGFSIRYVHSKTRQFVVSTDPNAVKIQVPITVSKRKIYRDSKGRFVTAEKAKRSAAAKKGAETRRLKREGIERVKRWIGRARDGSYTGYEYERYSLPILDASIVRDIIESVKRNNPGRRFLFNGAADFLDAKDRLFTNNTEFYLDTDEKAYKKLVAAIAKLIINPSYPPNFDRSEKVDVQGTFVVIRFERIQRTLIRKGLK